MDINSVVVVGRLTRDCELRYASTGLPICEISLAINRRKKEGDNWVDEVSFFSATIFGKQGEALQRYLVKGKQVAIQGELRQDRWDQEGQKRSKVLIIVNNLQLLGGRGDSAPQGSSNAGSQSGASAPPGMDGDSMSQNFEDDIPF